MASVDLPVQVTPLLPVSATPSDLLKHENEYQLSSSPALGFIFQSACHLHRYTRNDSDAHIVERADRLRSVFMGIAVAHGRLLSSDVGKGKGKEQAKQAHDETDLEDLLNKLNINAPKSIFQDWPFSIASTPRRLPLTAEAVKFAHGEAYCTRLAGYISDVSSKHAEQESEVPEPLSQGDLYLCQESLEAMEGALGACCEAVDDVCKTTSTSARRFVSIRPPGHHCETEGPMGFCWLNNVAVAAAYAHQKYGIERVVIFDIDLHHGNGTQEIAWRLNALAHKTLQARQKPSSPRKGSPKKTASPPEVLSPVLQVFYGSVHDIDSYPCEELDPQLIANASVNISGGGGSQFISNVHLEPYESEDDFHSRLYPRYRSHLFDSAKVFLRKTQADPRKTLVLVSSGFDASEHEYASMSRHGARVPTTFFQRFGRDVTAFADEVAGGKLIAVLEGGYSQRALSSGAGSLMAGLVGSPSVPSSVADGWFTLPLIEEYERLLSPQPTRGRKAVVPAPNLLTSTEGIDKLTPDAWKKTTLELYNQLVRTIPYVAPVVKIKEKLVTPPSSTVRTTRSRYNSPAVASKAVPSQKQVAIDQPVFGSTTMLQAPPITPVPSPSVSKTTPSASGVSATATPLIRFTFKAGDTAKPSSVSTLNPVTGNANLGAGGYRQSEDNSLNDDGSSSES